MADVRLARLAKVLLLAKMCPLQTLVYIGKSDAQGEKSLVTTVYADPDSRLGCAVRLQVPWIRSLMLLLKSRAIKLPQRDIWRALLISPDEAMMLTLLERINPDHGTTFTVLR